MNRRSFSAAKYYRNFAKETFKTFLNRSHTGGPEYERVSRKKGIFEMFSVGKWEINIAFVLHLYSN